MDNNDYTKGGKYILTRFRAGIFMRSNNSIENDTYDSKIARHEAVSIILLFLNENKSS